ncbi:C-GCAxxG-C-C family (seleno)protein [Anaerotignum sp.]
MLKARIQPLCSGGDNCSQIILQAAAAEYGFSLPEELLAACEGIHGGFGINGMCSALVAAVMVLGLLCDEEEIKQKRILFLLKAQERFCGLDCCRLSALGADCSGVLEEIAEILQEVIEA